jgi:hypothetical protein
MCTGRRITVSMFGCRQKNPWSQHVDLDEVADAREPRGRHQRGVLGEEVRVVRARSVDVGAGEDDDLLHPVLRHRVEHARRAHHVEGVVLLRGHPGVVHDPHVDDRLHVVNAEDVLGLLLPEVELEELHGLRRSRERSTVQANDPLGAVKELGERAPEVPADAGDHHHLS